MILTTAASDTNRYSVHLDFETGSTVDIKLGAYRYASDESTVAHCFALTVVDRLKGKIIDTSLHEVPPIRPHQDLGYVRLMGAFLSRYLRAGGKIHAWNATFERRMWQFVMTKRFDWPVVDATDFVDTAAISRYYGGPAALQQAGKFWCGDGFAKEPEGHAVMHLFKKPADPNFPHVYEFSEKQKDALLRYCGHDTVMEATIAILLGEMSNFEQALYLHNEDVNDRGVLVDIELLKAIPPILERLKVLGNTSLKLHTEGAISSYTQARKLKKWVEEQLGRRPLDSLDKHVIDNLLGQPHTPDLVKKVIKIRRQFGGSASSKFTTALHAQVDGRVHDIFMYAGAAATSRYSAKILQLQNMVRGKPIIHPNSMASLVKQGIDAVNLLLPLNDIPDQLGRMTRGMVIPKKDHVFVIADFASIEAMVLPWLASMCGIDTDGYLQAWIDKTDAYILQAAKMFGVDEDLVTDHQRQVGKVCILACGFMGGYRALQNMGRNYGMHIEDHQAQTWVELWRESSQWAVHFWDMVMTAFTAAFESRAFMPTSPVGGSHNIKFVNCADAGSVMRLTTPNQDFIQYNGVHMGKDPFAFTNHNQTKRVLLYKKGNAKAVADPTQPWPCTRLYSGIFVENITQRVARDLLCHVMLRCEEAGYPVVMHVHDEVVLEVPRIDGPDALEFLLSAMETVPTWATGLPARGAGQIVDRYQKI